VGRWITKDNRRIHIEDSSGRFGAVAVAVALGIAIASGGTVASGLGAGAGSGSAGGSLVSNSRVRAQDSANVALRLERRGLRVSSRLSSDEDCAEHSYGRVQAFFREHPCTALSRALFEARDSRRNVVLVAVAWVEMPDAGRARALRALLDGAGTGNVTELSRQRGRYRDVRFTGDFYASRRDGSTVVNAQAQPVGRAAVAVNLAATVVDALR